MTVGGDWVVELAGALPEGCLVTDPEIVASYRLDRSGMVEAGMPRAVVRASCSADVSATLKLASAYRVPVVARGAGTGLSGGSAGVEGCIVISTERMRSLAIEAPSCIAVVGPGILNGELKAAAREHGLWYPPDPSSFEICSIGGNLATNAGGLCCVKYGVTTDYVLGMEVVLADGRVLRLGGRTVKDVAGYDLKRLFVGSEGTLGVITEATLRLCPLPPPATTIVATFAEIVDAGHAVASIVRRCRPAALELMDRTTIKAVEAKTRMGLDCSAGALLIARSETAPGRGSASLPVAPADAQWQSPEAQWIVQACDEANATYIAATDDEDEGELFMAARRMAIPAVEVLGTVLIEDVGVPIPNIPDLVSGVERISELHDTTIAVIGHAGDGNFHPLVTFDRDDPDALSRAEKAFGEVMDLGLALGGTITGEHGVGRLKEPWLARQLGDDVMEVNRKIKRSLDPLGILNPGKWI